MTTQNLPAPQHSAALNRLVGIATEAPNADTVTPLEAAVQRARRRRAAADRARRRRRDAA
ncbi:hypothetical protein O7627_24290 [Solwaraspora sp. WMMD1047]|uniref:hypothetical protein n=1 Tax=Solwaraspora sp. WMMD1047 TaxID=3016102 RepID=UPI0024180BAE|nr:hypothetical protein [Solwaraspora sp. WMMD1047]MDG4832403.1 hypothetical protein [Solwaraspora sp. WMMD1047]